MTNEELQTKMREYRIRCEEVTRDRQEAWNQLDALRISNTGVGAACSAVSVVTV